MALKNTKGTAQRCIVKPFKNSESCRSIENHSVALKNLSNSERGLWAEKTVHEFLRAKNWVLVSERQKYKYGEIDFIFQRDQHVAIIEVKYLHNPWMSFQRISNEQLQRLKNNFLNLRQTKFKSNEVKLFLCFVDRYRKIEWVNLTE